MQLAVVVLFVMSLLSLVMLLYKNNYEDMSSFWNEILSIMVSFLMASLSCLWGIIQTRYKAKEKEKKIIDANSKDLQKTIDRFIEIVGKRGQRLDISSHPSYRRESTFPFERSIVLYQDVDFLLKGENFDFLLDIGVINYRQYSSLRSSSPKKVRMRGASS